MRKIKAFLTKSLYIELSLAVTLSFVAGLICFIILQVLSNAVAYSNWADSDFKNHKISMYVDRLQTYIYEEQVSSTNTAPLTEWYNKHQDVFFYIRKDYIEVA